MSARERILDAIRISLKRGPLGQAAKAAADARLHQPRAHIVPARAQRPHHEQVALFIAMAREASASLVEIQDREAVPEAVAAFLARHTLPPRLVAAPELDVDWRRAPMLDVSHALPTPTEPVAVTACFAGIAETGSVVLLSGPGSPTSLNFLPDNHVVALRTGDVLGTMEDLWIRLRALERGLPRSVNMITGPSRTGDIEQTLQLGAHGPRRLHIVLVHDRPPA
ncbi:MAG: LUD domain-containing protein [Rhodospirillales bacterium]|nr:LUD domain-containing protein [Rhodospirillales bacterium]